MSGRGANTGDAGEPAPRPKVLDPTALFRALADAGIDYILIGGLAVAAHGAIRGTKDLDICPNPAEENLRRLAEFLESVDARNVDQGEFEADELLAPDFEGLSGGGNSRLETNLGALDVMQYLEPFADETWDALDQHAEQRHVFGHTIRVSSYEDLLTMKEAAGRDQDMIDIENMKTARREL